MALPSIILSISHTNNDNNNSTSDLDWNLRIIFDSNIKCNNNEMNIPHLVWTALGQILKGELPTAATCCHS